jgi:hypothetical protein
VKAIFMETHDFTHACEQALAESVADVATELRLVNVIDLIGYVHAERCAILEDLVNSSAELSFKHGALRYAWSSDLEVLWEALPKITLDMEFCWRGVTAFFRLCLNAERAGVDITHLWFDGKPAGEHDKLERLKAALSNSRITPPRRAITGVSAGL